MSQNLHPKMSATGLIFTVLAAEVGISDVMIGYQQMGYAAIIWYLIAAVVYLLPLVMIFVEYSSSLKFDHGGFYSWLIDSLGEKWAFIGTFCWIGMIMIDVLQSVSGLGIHVSGLIQGKDTSGAWRLGFLNGDMIEALMGIVLVIVAVFIATKGIHKIEIVSVIGGIFVLAIFFLFMLLALTVFFADGMRFAQPVTGIHSFFRSPNPQFQSPVAVLSFVVYAMYAYGGIESSSGFIDKMKDSREKYPRAILIVAGLMASLDILGILACGMVINWHRVMDAKGINLYNNSFYIMQNLGVKLVKVFGGSTTTGIWLGKWLIRFLSLGALLPILGMVVALMYSPIKGLISGSRKGLWPKRVRQFNKHDMPSFAMWIEAAVIIVALIFISFTGRSGQQFYQIIVDMGNIGMLLPYIFLVIAFVSFKKRHHLKYPIVFFRSTKSTYITVGTLLFVMTFGIVMNLIEPIIQHQYNVAFWTFAGPVFFITLSSIMYTIGVKHQIK